MVLRQLPEPVDPLGFIFGALIERSETINLLRARFARLAHARTPSRAEVTPRCRRIAQPRPAGHGSYEYRDARPAQRVGHVLNVLHRWKCREARP
jgi:hypothetical protein